MTLQRIIMTCCVMIALSFCPAGAAFAADQGDTKHQILANYEEILKNNPMPPGQTSQMIKIAENDSISLYLIRMLEGAELGPHFHKERAETEYTIKGRALLLVDDKWVEMKAGDIHFNPAGKVHGSKNIGNEPLIVLIMFTPAMKEPDRHFVK